MNVAFVDYEHDKYNLCRGRLVVRLDGEEISFGVTDERYLCYWEKKADYPAFWKSGGGITWLPNHEADVTHGPWKMDYHTVDEKKYPKKIYKAIPELLSLMNEYVPFGCCGGCI